MGTDTHREGSHMKLEAETGVMAHKPKNTEACPEPGGAREARNRFFPGACKEATPRATLIWGFWPPEL